jgi:hypothetical protein
MLNSAKPQGVLQPIPKIETREHVPIAACARKPAVLVSARSPETLSTMTSAQLLTSDSSAPVNSNHCAGAPACSAFSYSIKLLAKF